MLNKFGQVFLAMCFCLPAFAGACEMAGRYQSVGAALCFWLFTF